MGEGDQDCYDPYSIAILVFTSIFLVLCDGSILQPDRNSNSDIRYKRGILLVVFVYLGYSILQAPNTTLTRPHPVVWKLVHGIGVVYLLSLTFVFCQSLDDSRQLLKHLHPALGNELPERSYGEDCRLLTSENPSNWFKNVSDTLFDEFVIAHTLGWFCKALVYRNYGMLWTLSVGFEVTEFLFRHILPNFRECWWDSIILDILICNNIGIYFGMKTVQFASGKNCHWLNSEPWFKVFVLMVASLAVDLNSFFLKYLLWIPTTNPLNTLRLIIWFLVANPAIREYYCFLHEDQTLREMGSYAWLAFAICIVECLVVIKFGNEANLFGRSQFFT